MLDVTYELQSPAGESVTLVYQGSSCGCTGVRINDKDAQPGDQFSLAPGGRAVVRLMTRLGASSGEKTYTATFTTQGLPNGPAQLTAQTHVRVLNDVEFSPQALIHEFTKTNQDRVERTLTVKRHYRSSRPVPMTLGLSALPSGVELVSVQEAVPSGKVTDEIWARAWEVRLAIQPPPEFRESSQSYPLSFTFNGADDPSLPVTSVPLVLRWTFGVHAPKSVRFGSVTKGKDRTRRILVRSMDGKEFAVTKIEMNSPLFGINPPTAPPRSSHWLDITYRPKDVGAHQARIVIETDHPDSARLVIEVTGTTAEG